MEFHRNFWIYENLHVTRKFVTTKHLTFVEVPSKEMRAVFLDLWKAFDRVWHDGLLYKVEVDGISGNILQLLQNFYKTENRA